MKVFELHPGRALPLVCLLLITLLAGPPAAGQVMRLTMDEAVRRALATGADTSSIAVANAQLERSKAYLPGNPFFSGGAGSNTSRQFPANYQFFLSQEVEYPGKRQPRIAAAEHAVEQAAWEQKSAQLDLSASVRTAFVHALATAVRVTLAEQNLDAARELTRTGTTTRRQDRFQRIERNIAAVQVTRAQREVAGAQQADEDARGRLRLLTGLRLEERMELVGSLRSDILGLPPPASLIQRARQQRPDLLAQQHAAQRAANDVTIRQQDRIPNVTLFGSVSRFENDTSIGGDLGIPIPIFQTGVADVQEAAAARDRSARELRELERTVDVEVLEAHRECVVAADNLAALQNDILPKLEENAALERRLYEDESVSVADLIGQQIDLLAARREHIDALETYNAALIELERVIGGDWDGA